MYDITSEIQTVHLKTLSSKDRFCGYLHLQDIASYEAIATRQMWKYETILWESFEARVSRNDWSTQVKPTTMLDTVGSEPHFFFAVFSVASWTISMSEILQYPRSLLTYSRGLRHLHLLMAIGIFGALGTAQAASYSEGQNKRTPQLEGMEVGWIRVLDWSWNPGQSGQTSNKNTSVSPWLLKSCWCDADACHQHDKKTDHVNKLHPSSHSCWRNMCSSARHSCQCICITYSAKLLKSNAYAAGSFWFFTSSLELETWLWTLVLLLQADRNDVQ